MHRTVAIDFGALDLPVKINGLSIGLIADETDGADPIPIELIIDNRRLADRRPGSADRRTQ